MSPTLALIPAKRHSAGVPDKNYKKIYDGHSCTDIAVAVGALTCDRVALSSDRFGDLVITSCNEIAVRRPAELCQPETPMIDVVRHALEVVPGPDDEIIVLLQPTSPLRTAETVKRAIVMLQMHATATSVVSVSRIYPWEWALVEAGGFLYRVDDLRNENIDLGARLQDMPSRRQDCEPTYKRDGVVYAFRRATLRRDDDIYGYRTVPLFTPPAESLSIDTPEDWAEAVRRLLAQHAEKL